MISQSFSQRMNVVDWALKLSDAFFYYCDKQSFPQKTSALLVASGTPSALEQTNLFAHIGKNATLPTRGVACSLTASTPNNYITLIEVWKNYGAQ